MTETATIKLQAWIAHQGILSRRQAEAAIAAGQVKVNGKVAHIGQRIDPEKDIVAYKNKPLSSQPAEPLVYYLVNKPVGLVSTTSDELDRETVLSVIPDLTRRVYPVGRLDKDSEGLMLLTNDGQLAYRLTHPKFEVLKTYEVLVNGLPTLKALNHLRHGVKLDEDYSQPAEVQIIKRTKTHTWLSITIHEGKQHQVRRMMKRVGYEVERLIRVSMGPFTLQLLFGQPYRRLKPAEVNKLLEEYFGPEVLAETASPDAASERDHAPDEFLFQHEDSFFSVDSE